MRKPLLIILVILTGVMLTACAAPAETPQEVSELEDQIALLETQLSEKEATAPAPTPSTFEPIVITGSGDKTSPPFTVTTEEWVIDWSYVPDSEYPEMAMFGFFVYPRGETAVYVESVLFAEETSGLTYSYAGAGEYYIKVTAGNVKSWEVVISPP